jgi:prepilin-type N-terminal cleavage/methylation domain-containing protein
MFAGFTLIELIIVIAIIAILAYIAIARYGPLAERARETEAFSTLFDIVNAEKGYKWENGGSYTGTLTNLDIYDAVPVSPNFPTYGFVTTAPAYAYANRLNATGGRLSYRLFADNGTKEWKSGTYP